MINRVLVLGGGSAGFLTAITLKAQLPAQDVVVIRSKDIGIIGVGEGTTVSVPIFLHGKLNIDAAEFHRIAQPTWKLGIRFLWGPRDYFNYTFNAQFNLHYRMLPKTTGFYCDDNAEYVNVNSSLMSQDRAFVRLPNGTPGIRNDVAYHIENEHFVKFLEGHAERIGIKIIDDTIVSVDQDERGITGLNRAAGVREVGDFYVDASGFYSVLLSKTLNEPFISFKSSLFCDKAVVGGWQCGDDEPIKPYTTAETMSSGWCWQIEHEFRINRGYVYSSAFISDQEAEKEFRAKNPKVGPTRIVKFISGRYQRAWVKNVCAIGNACGFVEPLESTSLAVICDEAEALAGSIRDSNLQPGATLAAVYNKRNAQSWDCIRQFLAIHYKFNTRLDTPFWMEAREKTEICDAAEFVEYYMDNGPSVILRDNLINGRDVFGFEGYLAMLVGQKVPYRKIHTPSDQEWAAWRQIQKANRAQAETGLSVKETLAVLRDPRWRFDPEFYRRTS